MLDQQAMQIVRNRLNSERHLRERVFGGALQKVQSEMASKGLGTSGAIVQAVADICASEVEATASEVWRIMHGLLREEKTAPSDEEVKTLHHQYDELFIPYCSAGPQRQFEAICQKVGFEDSGADITGFHARTIGARLRVISEIDEFIHALRKRAEAEKPDTALELIGGAF